MPAFVVGRWGVDIFFVISGFIMWVLSEQHPSGPRAFLMNRIIRIAPIYWFFTLLTAFISTDGGLSLGLSVTPERLIKSLFFVPQWNPVNNTVSPVLTVGWTLIIEMLFYCIFTVTLFVKKRLRLTVIITVLSLFPLAAALLPDNNHPASFLFARSMLWEFALGILLAVAYQRGVFETIIRRQRVLYGVSMLISAVLIAIILPKYSDIRLLYFGLPSFLCCAGGLCFEPWLRKKPSRTLLLVGNASYTIYLSHLMLLAPLTKIFPGSLVQQHPLLSLSIQILLALGTGCIAYLIIEKPLNQKLRKILHRKKLTN